MSVMNTCTDDVLGTGFSQRQPQKDQLHPESG
jgi:hypothetical protein